MNKKQVGDTVPLKTKLAKYCRTRSKDPRTRNEFHNAMKRAFYDLAEVMTTGFDSDPYLWTLTFPKKDTLEDEWEAMSDFIKQFKIEVSKHFLVVGGIISVEAHKNTTLKKKGGKNTKAGRPHVHMLLWFCHEFLNPSLQKLQLALQLSGTLCGKKALDKCHDVLRTGLYITKDKDDSDLQAVVQKHMGWSHSGNIWINSSEVQSSLELVASELKYCFISRELLMWWLTTKKNKDDGIMLSQMFYKLFTRLKLAVRGPMVYRKKPGTLFSWKVWKPLESWIADMLSLDAPTAYLEKLKKNALAREGKTAKVAPKFELFPKIKLELFTVEFIDVIYE